jgi:hypothetical protein
MAAVILLLDQAERDDPRAPALPLIAGLLPWIRPDLVILTAAFLGWRLLSGRRHAVRDLLIVGGLGLSYASTYWVLTGAPLPNTLSAKKEFFAFYGRPLWLNAMVLAVILGRWSVHFGPIVLALVAARRHRTDSVAVYAFLVYLAVMAVMGPNVLEHNYFRYLHPFVVPLLVAGLCTLVGWPRQFFIASSLAWIIWTSPSRWASYESWKAVSTGTQSEVAAWFSNNSSSTARVLVHDAGYLSETTTVELYDLVGLKSPSSTNAHAEFTGPTAGRLRAEALHRIACRSDPHFYVALNGWERAFDLTYDLSIKGWAMVPVLRTSRIWQGDDPDPIGYTVYRVIRSGRCREIEHERR